MNIAFASIGFLGSVASLVALFLGATGWKAKVIHGVYAIVILVLSGIAFFQGTRLSELHSIETGARRILQETEGKTSDGTILALMAFLEKARHEFPDTYERAKCIYEKNDIATSSNHLPTGASSLSHEWTKNDVAYALRGLVAGIAASSK